MKNILIIDDDREFSMELEDILKDEGYTVKTSLDGKNGLNLIENGNYDVILLDYKMNEMNGIDVLKKLKEQNLNKKIIMISGTINIEYFLEDGHVSDMVENIFYKPFKIDALLKSIRDIK